MSYRLIDSNALAIKYPEVNEMPCVFADLPDGLHGQFINAQPERKKGRWMDCGSIWDDEDKYHIWRCSECLIPHYKKTRFCPNCGVDMREEKTDEV